MPTFKEILDERFGGVIVKEDHNDNEGKACALELLSVKKGIPFIDDPDRVRCFDFRMINDMQVSDELRTEWMLRMLETYEDSLDWDEEKRKKVVERIIISTVNQLIAGIPWMPEEVVNRCKAVKTLEEAETAMYAVLPVTDISGRAAAYSVIGAVNAFFSSTAFKSHAAITSTAAIATAASSVAGDAAKEVRHAGLSESENAYADIFIKTCNLWVEAAKD